MSARDCSDGMQTFGKIIREKKFPHLMMVEASAGSGKTEALARRYVWLALAGEGRVPHGDISSILAITFTRKAAREMKERVLDLLKRLAFRREDEFFQETIRELGMRPDELQALATAMIDEIIERYSDFQIQTIDSFMYRVARSVALELDLSPDFEMTETYGELLDYSMSLLLRRVGPGRDPDITRLMDEFMALLNQVGDGSFKWRPEQEMRNTFLEFLETEAKETGDLAFEDHNNQVEECRDEIFRLHGKMKATGLPLKLEYMATLENQLKELSFAELFRKQYNAGKAPIRDKEVTAGQEGLLSDARNDWLYVVQKIGDLAKHHSLSRYHAYGAVYREFKHLLEFIKSKEGVLHIDDMRKTLNRHLNEQIIPDLYVRLGQRLYHFLIDEFQDTDPVQWASLYQLMTESLAQGGTLYLVGDLKQAIYMFRNADYRVMRDMMRDIRGENTQPVWLPASVGTSAWLERLEYNYRSAEVILDYVNTVFKKRLRSELGKDAFEQDLTGLTDFVQHPVPGRKGKGYVRTILFKKEEEPESRRRALLEIISDLRGRNYRYSDIAILARTNAEVAAIVDWLVAARVPASSSSSLDIRNRKVVAELIQLLKFLESPVDDLAFAGFVLGEILRRAVQTRGLVLDRDRLHGLLLAERRDAEYLYQAFRKDEKLARIWEECFESLYQKTGYYPLYDLTSLALADLRVFENFPEETGSLVKLLEVVNGLESEGRNSIRDFLECAAEGQDEQFALELPEYADAVRLMTFHKAKGLGFPVVINMISDHKGSSDALYYDKAGDKIKVHYINQGMAAKNDYLGRIYKRKRTDEQIQRLNSLYVVCTRASWELYNLVSLGKKEDLLQRLFESCEEGKKAARPPAESVPEQATRVELEHGDVSATEYPRERHWSYQRWLDAARGDVFHSILGQVEYLSKGYKKEIEEIVERSLSLTNIRFDGSEIALQVETFVSRPDVRAWFEPVPGRIILRERDFVDQHGNLHRMDRVIVDRERVLVIDYKTGEPQDYSDQLKTYMEILQQVYPEKEIKGCVAYVESGSVEEVA